MAAQDEVDVCESWEDMDDIGLDQKIKLMSSESATVSSALKACKVNVIVEDSACIGPQCVMPEPAIRILKRPSSSAGGQLNGESRARPVKTLEQRQKEYEEARLRILGEARSPEDVIDDNLSRLQDKLQANNLNESQTSGNNKKNSCHNDNNGKGKEKKVLARLPPGATAAGIFPSPPPRGVLVIRTPRGPDGTKGFVGSLLDGAVIAGFLIPCKTAIFGSQTTTYFCMKKLAMAGIDNLSARDRAVLRSIFDPTATIADVEDSGDTFSEEESGESTTAADKESIALCAQGVQLAEAGKLSEALEVLNRGVEVTPARAEAYNDRAQLLRLMQRDDDAMSDLDKALQLTADKKSRARALALCQRGVLLRKGGADHDARAAFAEAAQLGSGFARKQVVDMNPYAALCNQMLSQVMRGEKEINL